MRVGRAATDLRTDVRQIRRAPFHSSVQRLPSAPAHQLSSSQVGLRYGTSDSLKLFDPLSDCRMLLDLAIVPDEGDHVRSVRDPHEVERCVLAICLTACLSGVDDEWTSPQSRGAAMESQGRRAAAVA